MALPRVLALAVTAALAGAAVAPVRRTDGGVIAGAFGSPAR